jgi:hypothetical protein
LRPSKKFSGKHPNSGGGKSGVIYVKCTLVGLLAVLVAAILLVIVVVVVSISITSRSSQTGTVGWDPISIARPLKWLVVALGIFLIGFFWEFHRVRSK